VSISGPDWATPQGRLLIFGCGYLGSRVARLWQDRGGAVRAVTRSASKAAGLQASNIQPIVCDISAPEPALPEKLWLGVKTILFAVGYDRGSSQAIGEVYAGGLERVLRACPSEIERFIYISSTGVYGQATGGWVDEQTACHPVREGGKASLAAEVVLRDSKLAERRIILRLAGIYGPDRIPRAPDLRAGLPIPAPADGWLNLIHVEDAATIVLLAAERATPPATYVVSDGNPVLRADYYRELARLLKAPPPQFVPPTADSPAALRAGSDKRINPARLFAELQPQLQFPSYREGLAAIVAASDASSAT
jgi:nucleoside-diphosphate-sugar epimerase